MRAAVWCLVAVSLAAAAAARGQAPSTRSTPPPSPPSPAAAAPTRPDVYTYQSEGRRDPFVSLVGTGTEPRLTSKRNEGPAGMTVAEISVRGVVESRGAYYALVQGPDNKTYTVRSGDKFLDGTIRAVTEQGLVIVQQVNDPLSLVKQREVRKLLRSFEQPKEPQ